MSKMIQIRNVPDEEHRKLKARAALEGLSLSEYILRTLRRALERPSREELLERIAGRKGVRVRKRPAEVVRAERDKR